MNESFSKVYLKALLDGFESLTLGLPVIGDVADRVAGRLLAGGDGDWPRCPARSGHM